MGKTPLQVLAFSLLCFSVGAAPARGQLPEPVYTVVMRASLEPATRRFEGVEHLRWKNTSSVPLTELQFHLYLNAFANTRSTFFRESGGQLRNIGMPEDGWGFLVVDAMRLPDGSDLKGGEQFIQPDDGNPDDRTVARYPLPEPLLPGGEIQLEIAFHGQLPRVFARCGVHGDFVLAGQWFPKIAVFEDRGVRGRSEPGWNCHQYHASSEFYADFGNYDVTIVLPARYVGKIGATGQKVEERVVGDRVEARFVQEGVTDFAWTADPRYLVVRDRFDPTRDVPEHEQQRVAELLGVPPEEIALKPVDITLLLQPANAAQAQRYLSALKLALRGYGLRLGAYPYPHITLVDPPRGAMGAGGMEYMTFITLGTHPAMNFPFLRGILTPEGVTIHEFGHNYWMGMIASNEFEESWLDEGINSYYDMIITDEVYGAEARFLGTEISAFENNRRALASARFSDPIVRESWKFRPGTYGLHSYPRPAITLKHLENLVGSPAFHRAMRAFFQKWKFRHPSTADFEATFQEAVGKDLGWFFQQAFHTTAHLDYAVTRARSEKVKKPEGYVWQKGGPVLVREEKPAKKGDKDREQEAAVYQSEVIVERRGEFVHPVTVELTFADGSRERREWDGQETWVRFVVERPTKLVAAEVDPDHVLALDTDRSNNGRWVEPKRAPAAKFLVDVWFWLQALLAATGIVG